DPARAADSPGFRAWPALAHRPAARRRGRDLRRRLGPLRVLPRAGDRRPWHRAHERVSLRRGDVRWGVGHGRGDGMVRTGDIAAPGGRRGGGVDAAAVIVAGAGPVGLAAALLLDDLGYAVTLVAPEPTGADRRTSALLAGSIALLDRIGVWPAVEA